MTPEILAVIRSLGAGGLLGGGAASLAFLLFPDWFSEKASVEIVTAAGGLFGAGLHHYVTTIVDFVLFRPLVTIIAVYGRLLLSLPLLPLMSEQERSQLFEASMKVLTAPTLIRLPKHLALPPTTGQTECDYAGCPRP